MSSLPNPGDSLHWGYDRAPNVCNDCHRDRGPQWAAEVVAEWSSE